MKKLSFVIALGVMAIVLSSYAHASQFSIPYITAQSTTSTNAAIVFSTNVAPGAYMSCLQHVTVTASQAATFGISFSTVTDAGPLGSATTTYAVLLSTAVPFDMHWGSEEAYCGPPGTQMKLFVTAGGYTISCEQFTSKGMNP